MLQELRDRVPRGHAIDLSKAPPQHALRMIRSAVSYVSPQRLGMWRQRRYFAQHLVPCVRIGESPRFDTLDRQREDSRNIMTLGVCLCKATLDRGSPIAVRASSALVVVTHQNERVCIASRKLTADTSLFVLAAHREFIVKEVAITAESRQHVLVKGKQVLGW